MRRLWQMAVMLALFIAPAAVGAHEGHVHKVLGTVAVHDGNRVDVKTQDGKTVSVTVDAKTTYERGKAKVGVADLRVGDRVVIDVGDGKAMLARSIRLGAK